MSEKQKIPIIEWPGFIPPPEIEGMKWNGIIEIKRTCYKNERYYCNRIWRSATEDMDSLTDVCPIAIYEPAPILCPECGAEMVIGGPATNFNHKYWLMCPIEGHFYGPQKDRMDEALDAAECLRGLWEKKQKGKPC